jgi:hypothetical protein
MLKRQVSPERPKARSVDPAGIEPASLARQASVFPLDHGPFAVETMGIEPIAGYPRSTLAPLAHAPPAVAEVGFEPTSCGL